MDYLFNSESKLELLKKLSIWSSQEKNVKYLLALLMVNGQLILLSQKLIGLIG